jgi:hypothetical protein
MNDFETLRNDIEALRAELTELRELIKPAEQRKRTKKPGAKPSVEYSVRMDIVEAATGRLFLETDWEENVLGMDLVVQKVAEALVAFAPEGYIVSTDATYEQLRTRANSWRVATYNSKRRMARPAIEFSWISANDQKACTARVYVCIGAPQEYEEQDGRVTPYAYRAIRGQPNFRDAPTAEPVKWSDWFFGAAGIDHAGRLAVMLAKELYPEAEDVMRDIYAAPYNTPGRVTACLRNSLRRSAYGIGTYVIRFDYMIAADPDKPNARMDALIRKKPGFLTLEVTDPKNAERLNATALAQHGR